MASGQHALPVIDATGRLCGIVTARDLQAAAESGAEQPLTAAEVPPRTFWSPARTMPVSEALRRMGGRVRRPASGGGRRSGRPPAGAAQSRGHHQGLQPATLERQERTAGFPLTRLRHLPGATVHVLTVEKGSRRRGAHSGGTGVAGGVPPGSRYARWRPLSSARRSAADAGRPGDGGVRSGDGRCGGRLVCRPGGLGRRPCQRVEMARHLVGCIRPGGGPGSVRPGRAPRRGAAQASEPGGPPQPDRGPKWRRRGG